MHFWREQPLPGLGTGMDIDMWREHRAHEDLIRERGLGDVGLSELAQAVVGVHKATSIVHEVRIALNRVKAVQELDHGLQERLNLGRRASRAELEKETKTVISTQ